MSSLTIQQAFQAGMQHHQAGRLKEAEQIYRQILVHQPQHADALHFLGVIAYQMGQHDAAIDLMRKAIAIKPNLFAAHNNLGNALKDKGSLAEAVEAYRQAAALKPDLAEAHCNLGGVLKATGRLDEAVEACRRAIAIKPGYAEAYNALGDALRERGEAEEGMAAFRRAMELNPKLAEASINLGNALKDKGELEEAVGAYRQAVGVRPDYAEGYYNLGVAFKEMGRLDEAIGAYERAIELKANYAEARSNLGVALKERGDLDAAVAVYRQAIVNRPEMAEAYSNLGNALREKGELEEAVAMCRRAIELKPELAEGHNNLGNALTDKGDVAGAVAAYRRAIVLRPEYAEAYSNLGNALKDSPGQLDEAIAALRKAIALKPGYAEAYNNLGSVLKDKGELDAAMGAYREAVGLKAGLAEAHSNVVFTLHYSGDADAEGIAEEHKEWGRRHGEPGKQFMRPHENERAAERRIRVGYVSPDFRRHAVARFLLPLLEAHDHEGLEIFAYAEVANPDGVTGRIRGCVDQWRSIVGVSDVRAAEMIREDGIDILVDLAGHTSNNRLRIFAQKPAPVQVTWLGYPNTTGLKAMDYRLTDGWADPVGMTEALYTEELVRLPRTAWCFERPGDAGFGVRGEGPVTFGSFNNLAKVTDEMLGLWGRILRGAPGTRLVLKSGSLTNASVQERVRGILLAAGVAGERVDLRGWQRSEGEHLASYGGVDIALDTFPYHGTTTTCEALWMGVPVVTLAGRTHVSRVGVSLLSNVGLGELIAPDAEAYVDIAVRLAGDQARLRGMRESLRGRMEGSALMDAEGFARDVEGAYRGMWRKWCAAV